MQRYGDFQPTGHDPRGLGLQDQQDWLVLPTGRTRDSEEREVSNFETAMKILSPDDEDGDDVETHRFGHWGPGWFEIIIVRPGTAAAERAEDIEAALDSYPILDDEDCSRREWEAHSERVSQECRRVAWKHEGEVLDDADLGTLCDSLSWDHHGRSPSDEDIFSALSEGGWFIPDEEQA